MKIIRIIINIKGDLDGFFSTSYEHQLDNILMDFFHINSSYLVRENI